MGKKLAIHTTAQWTRAMKKKEFVDMLGDYMKEISDPNNKVNYYKYVKIYSQNTIYIWNN